MRYLEVMTEAIPHRPRNMRVYVTNRIRELTQMLATLTTAKNLIKQGQDGESIIRYAARAGTEELEPRPDETNVWYLESLNLDNEFQITRLKESLESYLRFGSDPGYDFLRYVTATLDDVVKYQREDYRQQYEAGFKMVPYLESGLLKYGWEPGNPEHEADPDYIAAKKLVAAYRLMAKVYDRIVPLEADMRSKLGVIQRMRSHSLDPHKFRPEHGDVETLYHATAFVPEILRDGFSAERPIERRGLGNFGQQEAISFTHDLEIARNIMRAFKEIWMIAHGELTMPQIFSWAKAEGIEDDLKRRWASDVSRPLDRSRNADPDDVVRVYRNWLAFTKLRDDPMLVSPWEIVPMMKERKLRDIGVLACEVRLEQTDAYQFGEAEFRLPADRVMSVARVL